MRAHLVVLSILGISSTSWGQSATTGAIIGRVTDDAKQPLADITVVATGPALQEPQAAITNDDGTYKISELPPGDYTVSFFTDKVTLNRNHVHVGANDAASVYQIIPRQDGPPGTVIEIDDTGPQINIVSTDKKYKFDKKFMESIPMPNNTFIGPAGTTPGAQNDGSGLAFSGSTSLENRYLVDGIDITGLTFGTVGTPLLNEFIEEVEVITGGYNAEWGRATGGIVNVVTKSGSNTFKGSVFGTLTPGFLAMPTRTTPVNASSIDVTTNRAYDAHFGAELGGPIIKNRLWFYAGFAPELSRTDFTRTTKRQTDCRVRLPSGQLSPCDAKFASAGGYADGSPDIDPRTGFFITDTVDSEVRSATSRTYTAIGKLNLAVSPQHQVQASLIAVPSRAVQPGILGLATSGTRSEGLTTDSAVRWTSKLDEDHTELEATLAWHRSSLDSGSIDPMFDSQPAQQLVGGSLGRWAGLGGESAKTTAGCVDGTGDPYPGITNCPTAAYNIGGPGALQRDREDRKVARFAVLERAQLLGNHELKAGVDIEDDQKELARLYSGGGVIQNFGTDIRITRWVALAPPGSDDPRYDQVCTTPDTEGGSTTAKKSFMCQYLGAGAPGTTVRGETVNWAAYLRDSWQIVPSLTFNAGVRYEEQRMRYAEGLRNAIDPLTGNQLGENAMTLTGNWAPRLGLIWDPTEEGKSKLFGSWGRFFESIPMDINDRSFGGEVSLTQDFNPNDMPRPCGQVDPTLGIVNGTGCLMPSGKPTSESLLGSKGVLVEPGIQAEYLDELLIGGEYQLTKDMKIGLSYQNRRLGRVIEDVSTDGAQTYVIANPGELSRAAEDRLQHQVDAETDPATKARLGRQLQMFRGLRIFDKPTRDYDAIELTVAKKLTRGLFMQASYTYSRTQGNYPGSLSYDNGQVDPNISSQYDLIELLANRYGRLPQDRPHSFKLDGYYTFEIDDIQRLTVGGRLRALSGVPINALGAHYLYGPNESFLLPRGAMGRSDFEHGLDLHIAYARKLPHDTAIEVFADVFNAYDRQGTFNVDETYAPTVRQAAPGSSSGTVNNVNPISGGSYEDLMWAKTIDRNGSETQQPTARNPNFLRTTTRYAPASAQVGFRLTF